MRPDPLILKWAIRCPSEDDAARLRTRLSAEITPDATFVDEVRSAPGNRETVSSTAHRLGDYFAEVRMVPDDNPSVVVLQFVRRLDGGPFWKDYMVRLLGRARQEVPQSTAERLPA